ncbi:1-acyl-sn-glycerol-3-phosphate acyltransferase [Rubrivivax gelatinosus]|uniref:1-acyl-sn-glycerol-3-phosphate acyltransferase n=2 Tax=Rubrivivax gelatinosus TaxID=28068 RepID=A0A4R2MAX0_RUBGE|nr:MFS transporter [Rubrivivax gelatinosus]TCP03852.1 1-acyl-sn-glycerol-3-phosphate acyltransferase [Rubrivivax gelatinosus]
MSGGHPNQFALLAQRRFAPFFAVQFLGAGNDNLFKFAFTVMATYQLQLAWMPPSLAGLVIGAVFILPFVLFSATAGQLADKHDKALLARWVKSLEIAIMAAAVWGFVHADAVMLLACVFGMGLHSTLFGPVKYAYLPQHLDERELTGGNGLVEMGTFVAILLGNLAGGLLMAVPEAGARLVAFACLGVALLGRLVAQAVPRSPAPQPDLVINWNPFSETWRNLRLAHEDPVVFRSLLGISWMWAFGAVFLSQFPAFAKDVLHGDEQVASLLLVLFSVGVGVGALLCETLSRRHVEIGLVPLGAAGMSVFAVDLYFAAHALPASALMPVGAFVAQPAHWRVMADLTLLALAAGVYSVPMYALIQLRSPVTHRARIIAANNILNALFMIASALGAGALLGAGLSIPGVFLVAGVVNALVAGAVFWFVPEYLLRCLALLHGRLLRRLGVAGVPPPADGAALLVGPAPEGADLLLPAAAGPRPLRWVVDRRRLAGPGLGALLRRAGAVAWVPAHEDAAAHAEAVERAAQALAAGELVGLFVADEAGRAATLAAVLARQPVPVLEVRYVPGRPAVLSLEARPG